jgi:adenine-specific DNA-methyltransferase
LNKIIDNQKKFAQYFTPISVAKIMVDMVDLNQSTYTILDPGAGEGILSTLLIENLIHKYDGIELIDLTAVEIDPSLIEILESNLSRIKKYAKSNNVVVNYSMENTDFLEYAANHLYRDKTLFEQLFKSKSFDIVITNPPYKKINLGSKQRKILSELKIETSNIYSAFIALAHRFVSQNGQLIAITPRSFANGTYFKSFRRNFFEMMKLDKVYIFQSRNKAFSKDKVLQENIIFSAKKDFIANNKVQITTALNPDDPLPLSFKVDHNIIVNPLDRDKVIHIPADEQSLKIIKYLSSLNNSLENLKINVSTGPVVDFRSMQIIKSVPNDVTIPLIYSFHFKNGKVNWPLTNPKKDQFILHTKDAAALPSESDYYVLCKRFSSKEEKKRIVAVLFDPNDIKTKYVAFENHLNFYHSDYRGISENLSKGLMIYLNSNIVDQYFRIFNGHTQVNATDLRMLKYPSIEQLNGLAKYFEEIKNDQTKIDHIIEKEIFGMDANKNISSNKKKIDEALQILKEIGMPKEQLNERSALTLLTIAGMKPELEWCNASDPMIGITEIMDYIRDHFGKTYAPNSRETIRRFTIHQFVQAGLVIPNPDKPRAINSPQFVYQIEKNFIDLLKTYETKEWEKNKNTFLKENKTLKDIYSNARTMQMIPLHVKDKLEIYISPGGQNELIKKILEEFCPRFTPGADLIYIGDAGKKFSYNDEKLSKKIGIGGVDEHGKMPDLILFYSEKKWIVLIEAVTSHGPMNEKRKIELKELFKKSKYGLVFVTAFLDKKGLNKYLSQIAWETEVWNAEDPSHLIHFNGKRFLGPY